MDCPKVPALPDYYITLDQAMEFFGLSHRQIERLVKSGQIDYIKINRTNLTTREAVSYYMERGSGRKHNPHKKKRIWRANTDLYFGTLALQGSRYHHVIKQESRSMKKKFKVYLNFKACI